MRTKRPLLLLAFLLLAAGCSEDQPNPTGVTPGSGTLEVAQGKRTQLTALPFRSGVQWSNLSGADAGFVSSSGLYNAPIHLDSEREVTLQADGSGLVTRTVVRVKPGPVTPEDCLGHAQPASEAAFGAYVFVEELPEAIVKINPTYPDAARNAGVDGLVMIQAHVCACGQVDSVVVVKSIPLLDDAAKAAVRQWLFKPGLVRGEATAVWVGVPCKFSLH